jgi:predicted nucleotidyltransferase
VPRPTEVDLDAIGAVLARSEHIGTAWVFGSVARGEVTQASDLDIAVLLRATGVDALRGLRSLATDLQPFSPSGAVDIVVLAAQGPVFRHRVLEEGRLVLDRDPAVRIDFEGRTIVEYLDWRPTHDIAMASTFEGLRRRFAGGSS